ncbi:MAG: T9SS type A sorting domain-containing protein [Flavobacteriales bacterium]
MKKILFSLAILVSLTTLAQSLSINPSESYFGLPNETLNASFDVTNNSAGDLEVIVTRLIPETYDSLEGFTSTFCWGTTCYPPHINVSTTPMIINAGASFDGFKGTVSSMPVETELTINYCFSVVDNPSNKVCTDVNFTSMSVPVGLEETETLFSVYPNPANDILHLKQSSQKEGIFMMYDLLGNKIYSDVITTSKSIELHEFNAGIYFYTFSINGKDTEVQKLVISH